MSNVCHVRQAVPDAPRDDAEVRRALDIALRFGQLLLSCQVGTADVASTIVAVTAAYRLPAAQVNVTVDSITVSIPRGVPGAPVTAMYVVPNRSLDYTRLQSATEFAQLVVDTTPALEWVQQRLDELERAEHRYPRWVPTAALGVMAGAFSVLLGAGPLVMTIAGLTTALIDRVGRVLNRRNVPILFQQVIGAALATGVAIGLDASGRMPPGAAPSLVVAANIVALLSGLATVGSVQDAITGYQLTASSRMLDIVLMSVGILIGVTVAVRIGAAAGVHLHLSPNTPIAALGVPLRVLAGAVGAAASALSSYAPPRAALAAGAAGAAGSLVFYGLQLAGIGSVESSFIAAVGIGLAGALVARHVQVPPLVIVMAGIIPLVPGMALARGFVELVHGHQAVGFTSIGVAAATALSLGAGVVLGPLLAPSIRRELARHRPHLPAGPRRAATGQRMPQLAGIRYVKRRPGPRRT